MAYFSLIIYTALIYIRPQELFLEMKGFPLIDIVAIVAIFLSIITNKLDMKRFFAFPQNKLILLFLAALIISHLSHTYMHGALNALIDFGKIAVLYFLITTLVDTPKKLKIYVATLIFLTPLLAIQGIQQYYTGFGWGGQTPIIQKIRPSGEESLARPEFADQVQEFVRIRGIGIFADPNDLALAFVMAIPFVLTPIFAKNRFPLKVISISTLLIFLYATYLTNSRGGYLALAATIYIFFFVKFSSIKGRIAGALTILLLLIYAPSRMGTVTEMEASTLGRMDAWSYGLQMFKSNPLFGMGMNMYTDTFPKTAHNSFLLILAETGLLGTFFWTGLFYVTFRDLLRVEKLSGLKDNYNLKSIATPLLVSLFGFLSAAFFLSRAYIHLPYIIIGLSVTTIGLLQKENKNLKTVFSSRDFIWVLFIIFFCIVFIYVGLRFLWYKAH